MSQKVNHAASRPQRLFPYSINYVMGVIGLPGIGHSLAQLAQALNMTNIGLKGGRHGQMMSIAVSKELRNLFADPTFTDCRHPPRDDNTPPSLSIVLATSR